MAFKKIAFVFPGQGTVYTGMGQSFYEKYPEYREVYALGSRISGVDLADLTYNRDDIELGTTENQSLSIHTFEYALFTLLKSFGVEPAAIAGFSLGEFAALAAAGTFRYEDSLPLVCKRGRMLSAAVPKYQGKMMAINGLSLEKVQELVDEVAVDNYVAVSIVNNPGRVTVSGWLEGLDKLAAKVLSCGGKISYMRVEGPFHSCLIDGVAARVREMVDALGYQFPKYEYYSNSLGRLFTKEDDFLRAIELHTSRAVLWQMLIEDMVRHGVDTIVEVGPRHGLTGMNKRIVEEMGADVALFGIENTEELDAFLEAYREACKTK